MEEDQFQTRESHSQSNVIPLRGVILTKSKSQIVIPPLDLTSIEEKRAK